MPDVSVQFHATPEENIQFLQEIVRDFALNAVGMSLSPFKLVTPSACDGAAIRDANAKFSRWAFTLNEPIVTVENEVQFSDKNPSHLRLDIGKRLEKALYQSWLSARTEDAESVAVWRKIAARLKRRTMKGVVALNPNTGATCQMKSFRFTSEAKALHDQGIVMLPFAGNSILRFED